MSRPPARRYSEEDVERGLQALALWQGNRIKASQALVDAGHPVPDGTLRDWKRRHPDRYERARLAIQEKVWAEMGEEWQELSRKGIRAAGKLADKAEQLTEEGNLKEAATAARAAQSLGVLGGIGTDKVGVAQQRPPVPQEPRDLGELIRIVSRKFGHVVRINDPAFLEGTADEIPSEDAPGTNGAEKEMTE